MEEGGWIQSFYRIKRLTVNCTWAANFSTAEVSLVPFCKFSPSLKSLRVTSIFLPRSQVFNLVYCPVHLSRAKEFKGAVFRCGSLSRGWVAKTLETITP